MPAVSRSKYLVTAGWDDVPHLTEQTKRELLESTEPHLRDARRAGIPGMGAGAIYPLELSDILIAPFQLPPFWPRAYGLDVGWKRTAAIWGAWDRSVDVLYCFTEHYRGKAEPSIHTTAIQARGEWIPGAIDPASRGRGQKDGAQLIYDYRELGLLLHEAPNAVEAGLYAVWERLSTGRLKIFETLMNFQAEYRLYRRDEDGNIIKDFDHLMDALRYLVQMFKLIAATKPVPRTLGTAGIGDRRAGY